MTRPHVLVIGGGIGGLCLAQGLRRVGVPVTVFERDSHPAGRWEGYCIHIDPAGARSLHACLPDNLWQAFLATSAPGGDFGFLTEQLHELLVVEEAISHPRHTDPTESHYVVDRRALRRVLLADLGETVRFGAEFQHYGLTGDGRVIVNFADGQSAIGDILVGADGVGSRVRRQYLPDAEPIPAGVVGLGNKLMLTESTRAWVPERLQQGKNVILRAGPCFLFISAYRPPPGGRDALVRIMGAEAPPIDQPYMLIALLTDPKTLPDDVASLDSDELRDTEEALIAHWNPTLRRLIVESEPADRGVSVFRVAPEHPPWRSSNVTLLGDAIHAVPATGGLGGNTALRDARRLTQLLATVERDGTSTAIGTYENDLRDHGYAAIREALAVRDRMLAHGFLTTLATRTWLRLCRHSAALRRRSFGETGAVSQPRAWERESR